MPAGPRAQPNIDYSPRVISLYFILPPGGTSRGEYTPQIVIPRNCLVQTLRSIIINSLPSHSTSSIELFTHQANFPRGWYTPPYDDMRATLLDWQSDRTIDRPAQSLPAGWSICVSVKILDETLGCSIIPHNRYTTKDSDLESLVYVKRVTRGIQRETVPVVPCTDFMYESHFRYY